MFTMAKVDTDVSVNTSRPNFRAVLLQVHVNVVAFNGLLQLILYRHALALYSKFHVMYFAQLIPHTSLQLDTQLLR